MGRRPNYTRKGALPEKRALCLFRVTGPVPPSIFERDKLPLTERLLPSKNAHFHFIKVHIILFFMPLYKWHFSWRFCATSLNYPAMLKNYVSTAWQKFTQP